MTDILSTNDSLFTKNDMIMTDNGYYANMPILFNAVGGKKSDLHDKVSNNYKNLGIPALYLYTINDNCHQNHDVNEMSSIEYTDSEIMSDDLYNKLITLAELKPVINKKYTRNKQHIKKNKVKKTRRNKKN